MKFLSGDMSWVMEQSGSGVFNTTSTADNITLTCAARNIQGPVIQPYSTVLLTTVRALQAFYFLLIFILGISLNTLVVILIAKYKKLHNYAFFIALQVIVPDLVLAVAVSPFTVVSAIANQWMFGELMCGLFGMFLVITLTARSCLMFVFVLDRFLAVFMPFYYPKHKIKINISLSIASWIFSVILAIIAFTLDCVEFLPERSHCIVSLECNEACGIALRLLLVGFFVPFSTFVPIILYTILYAKALKAKKASTVDIGLAGVTQGRDWKATITFSLLFLGVFLVNLPGTLVIFIIAIFFSSSNELPAPLYVVSALSSAILYILVITDPIIIMRNKDTKEIIVEIVSKMLSKRPHSSTQTATRVKIELQTAVQDNDGNEETLPPNTSPSDAGIQ